MKNTWLIALICLFASSPVIAQDGEMAEETMDQIESLAESIGDQLEDFGENADEIAEKIEENLEAWSEKYSDRWESWADQLEERLEQWAERQERVWEDWAEQYSREWERWAEELENREGDWDAEKITKLVEKNMKMLSKMPVDELVEGLMREGAEGIDNVPWESFADLQEVLQDSVQRSIEETERRLNEAKKMKWKADQQQQVADQAEGYLLPVIEAQQKAIGEKEKVLAKQAEQTRRKLEALLKSENIDADRLNELVLVLNQQKAKQLALRNEAEKIRWAELKNSELKRSKIESELQGELRQRLENTAKNTANKQKLRAAKERIAVDQARLEAERRLAESVLRQKQKQSTGRKNEKQRLTQLLELMSAEESKIQQKNAELEELRNEIRKLRKEVERLKNDHDG